MRDKIDLYLEKGIQEIQGGMGLGAAQLLLALDECQRKNNISGGLFEIGVHHGRSSILLGLIGKQTNSSLTICDLFSNQQLNESMSGRGDKDIFYSNYRKWLGNMKNLKVFDMPSSWLRHQEEIGNYRMVHINGGHSASETMDDLFFAKEHLSEGGAIILDDSHNYRFPGVSEGLTKFLLIPGVLTPVAVGKNKTVLCEEDSFDFYKNHLATSPSKFTRCLREESSFVEEKSYFGKEVLVYGKRS